MKIRRLSFFSFLTILFLLLTLFGAKAASAERYSHPRTDKEMFSTVVRIMNTEESSGGTGVILRSGNTGSLILTNKHVCRLVEHGGVVEAPNHLKHSVIAYKLDLGHDLCLTKVGADLRMNLSVAKRIPDMGDEAIVAGHPALLPTIVTRGHFSEHMIITVSEGDRACTDEEKQNPNTILQCTLYGTMPVTVMREGQLISSLIMPGSSGSPVFNKKGEIAGMVFAGSGSLSFGIIVPLEYIRSFLSQSKDIPWTPSR